MVNEFVEFDAKYDDVSNGVREVVYGLLEICVKLDVQERVWEMVHRHVEETPKN